MQLGIHNKPVGILNVAGFESLSLSVSQLRFLTACSL
jgi:hypothetical protein